jgi:hypothetical protein
VIYGIPILLKSVNLNAQKIKNFSERFKFQLVIVRASVEVAHVQNPEILAHTIGVAKIALNVFVLETPNIPHANRDSAVDATTSE